MGETERFLVDEHLHVALDPPVSRNVSYVPMVLPNGCDLRQAPAQQLPMHLAAATGNHSPGRPDQALDIQL